MNDAQQARRGSIIRFIRFGLIAASVYGSLFLLDVVVEKHRYRSFDAEAWIGLAFAGGLALNAIYLVFVGPVVVGQPLAWPLQLFRIFGLWLEIKEQELKAKMKNDSQSNNR